MLNLILAVFALLPPRCEADRTQPAIELERTPNYGRYDGDLDGGLVSKETLAFIADHSFRPSWRTPLSEPGAVDYPDQP